MLETKLRGNIARLKECLDTALEYKTPFAGMLAQALDEKQARLAQLIDLQAGGYSEQRFNSFLTPSEQKMFNTIETVLDSERIRLNLLLASSYLFAFELLNSSIIDNIEGFFVHPYQAAGKIPDETYARSLDRYEQMVGVKSSAPSNFKLLPSCEWLRRNGVLDKEEIEDIKEIREHRHTIAHNLPELILSEAFLAIDLEHLKRIRELIRKIELFWVEVWMNALKTGRESPGGNDVSGRELALDVIIGTVLDYMGKTQDGESI